MSSSFFAHNLIRRRHPRLAALSLWALIILKAVAATPEVPVPATPKHVDNDGQTLALTIPECISRALLKNLDISLQRIAPQIASAQTMSARGIFDPTLHLQYQYGSTTNAYDPATGLSLNTRNDSYQLGVSQLAPLGTQFGLNLKSANSQDNLDHSFSNYSSLASLELTQPLLKGFGSDITAAQIRIARHGEAAADAEFRSQVEQIISNVVAAYNELIFDRDSLASQQTSLDLAQRLLEDNKMRVKAGVMTPLDISQAASEVATRRDAVLQARLTASEQETLLKTLISDDIAGMIGLEIVPKDRPVTDLTRKPALVEMGAALKNRPDYLEAIEQAKQSKIQLVFSQNQTLPQLNLNASYGYGGLGNNLGSSFGNLTGADSPQWFLGMSVQVPFGNREAVSKRNIAQLQRAEKLLQLKKLEQDILVQVSNAATRVNTNQERIGFSHTATEYAKSALKAEQEKLNAGSTTTYTVLQMQRDLAQAETNELRASADLQKSEVELYRVQGTTLKVYHVEFEPASASKNSKAPKAR